MPENTCVPLYQQIKEDIKSAIERGKYKPKEKIPPEPELSAEYSVSRITVRRAVEELCNEGYLVKMQGRGTFVSTPRIHRKMTGGNRMESFSKTCREYGMEPGARLLDRKIVPVREDEKAFWGCEEETLLLYIQRVGTADVIPLMQANWYNTSAFAAIEEVGGRRVTDTSRRTIEIARASSEQASALNVPLGEPLLFLNCYFIDQNQKPLCIGRQYYVGSRYMFEM